MGAVENFLIKRHTTRDLSEVNKGGLALPQAKGKETAKRPMLGVDLEYLTNDRRKW